ncbi:Nuclear import receptor [Sorochytrium milnesiophthora]
MADTSQLLQAISTLYQPTTDAATRKAASDWLESFEKQREAWELAARLLRDASVPTEARIFSAQVIRHKVSTELHTLDVSQLDPLRQSMIDCLNANIATKAIVTQLCCALAELAIHNKHWHDPVKFMTEQYGGRQETTFVFLEFLTVLPEELEASQKVLTREEYNSRYSQLLESNASSLFQSLVSSLCEQATPFDLKQMLFRCLESWMNSQAIPLQVLNATPIVDMAFGALKHQQMFDSTVSILSCVFEKAHVEIVKKHETGLHVANVALPQLAQCKDALSEAADDEDLCRGYCRLFSAAGENMLPLIVDNPQACSGLLQGLLMVTSFHHLDAVKTTFPFWYYLSECLNDPEYHVNDSATFVSVYSSLVDIMVGHLRYPNDDGAWTAKERDEFRDFRHEMGDVLKDCVHVLGDSVVLSKAYALLETALSKGATAEQWRDIEAPLFALRTTGSAVRPEEAQVLPNVMAKLPQLPQHPKIRHSVIMLIGVVSQWTRAHPEYLPYQMEYISSGFHDDDVVSSAAKTLKYLCRDCGELLIDYLQQLHSFYASIIPKVSKDDSLDITEGIAHIIARAPLANMLELLRSFTLPILTRLSQVLDPSVDANSASLVSEVNGLLHRLSFFVKFVEPNVPQGSPHPVVVLLGDIWALLAGALAKFPRQDPVTEGVCKVLRASVNDSCADHYGSLIQKLVELLATSYEQTHFSCYLWVSMHVLDKFALRGNGQYQEPLTAFFTQISSQTFAYLQQTSFGDHEVVDEYFGLVDTFLNVLPQIFFGLPLLPSILQCSVAAMNHTCYPRPLASIVTFLHDYVSYISPKQHSHQRGQEETSKTRQIMSQQTIQQGSEALAAIGYEVINSLIGRRLEDLLPADSYNDFTDLILQTGVLFPNHIIGWINKVIGRINSEVYSDAERLQFTQDIQRALQKKSFGNMRDVLNKLAIVYKRRTSHTKRRY